MQKRFFTSKTIITTFLSTLTCFVNAAPNRCPLPIGMEMSVSLSKMAIGSKIMGLSKSDFKLKMPEPPQKEVWLKPIINEVADEVFDYPTLHPEVYAGYRFEVCFIKQRFPEAKTDFAIAHPLLKNCEQMEDNKRLRCAMKAAQKASDTFE